MERDDNMDMITGLFVKCAREILKDNLAGVYLHGSAVMGCYQPKKSDLDFLVVVKENMTDADKRAFYGQCHPAGRGRPRKRN
jgi:Nucleotidyltransferase domain.